MPFSVIASKNLPSSTISATSLPRPERRRYDATETSSFFRVPEWAINTTSPSSASHLLSSFILELSVRVMPPKNDAEASSYAPVIETPASNDAKHESLSTSSSFMPSPSKASIALTKAVEYALELFRPLDGGILELTWIL